MSDVFISYAHEDTAFVDRLRAALTEAGRDVWVDTGGIEPADRWRVSAHEAIERSDALLFVISPHSLRSDPCLGELEHASVSNKRVVPVCVDEAAADMEKPPQLDELSWIMMRPEDDFQAGIAAIVRALDVDLEIVRTHTRILVRAKAWELAGRRASPLLRGEELRLAEQWLARAAASGSPPTELQHDFIAASRRAATRRLRTAAGVAGVIAVVAVVLSVFALVQRSHAIHEATVATSRQLAALSESELSSNLDVGLLLAVRAYRTEPNAQTRAALLQADLYSPRLSRFLTFGADVTALTGSGDRGTVLAGLADGRVMRWLGGARAPSLIASLGRSVSSVAVSRDGQTIAAATGTLAASTGARGVLWRAGRGLTSLRCPAPQAPDAVGVSPSGATVVVHCRASYPSSAQTVLVLDGNTGTVSAMHLIRTPFFFPADVVVSSDAEVLLFDGAYGPWQQRRIADWALEASSSGTLRVHQALSGYSDDGRFVTATNNAPTIPVWPTSTPTDLDPAKAPFTAQAPISAATALTLSPGAGELAVADTGTIYVAPVAAARASHGSPEALLGNGSINSNALQFFGDGNHLLSATGATVAVWDLTQFDRLARAATTSLPSPCDGCGGALTAVSPDGRRVAAVSGTGNAAMIQGLGTTGAPQTIAGYDLGPPLWDGETLVLPLTYPAGSSGTHLPAGVRLLPPAHASETILAAALTDHDRRMAVVDSSGDVYVQDAVTGRVTRLIRGPRDLQVRTATALFSGMAAIDAAQGLAAVVDNGVVRLIDIRTGAAVGHLPGDSATYVAFGGPRLLVQDKDGSLEVWNARGTARQRVIAGDQSYGFFYPIPDAAGDLVLRQRSDGTVALADLSSGATLATLPAPASPSLGLRIGLAFSTDSQNLITVVQTVAGTTPEIIQRAIGAQTLVHAACVAAGRNLTSAEWRSFVGTSPAGNLACR